MASQRTDTAIEPLLTRRQVCEIFNVSHDTVDRWAQGGWLTPLYVGPAKYLVRFRPEEVRALLDQGFSVQTDAGDVDPTAA